MKSKNFAQQHLSSLGGIKVIAMLLLFWWHSSIPIPNVDLGARTCELLFVTSVFFGLGIIIFIKVCQKHGRLHLCMQLRKLYVQFSKQIFPNKAWLNVAWEAIHSVTLLFSTDVISAESVDICSTNRTIRLCSALVKSMSCISSQYMKNSSP